MSTSKLVKGTFLIIIGNFIFRIGGYIYRFLMSRMLGPEGYGILGLTMPFQGIFQILAAGGLPPAIAKYVAEYMALDKKEDARAVLYVSMKLMILLAFIFSLVIFFTSPWIACNFFHKPNAILPLQAVALILPFSVIVGVFRGLFQGIYKMEYIVVTRFVEQVGIIIFAAILVVLGFYVVGAVIGTALGFLVSLIASLIVFKKYLADDFTYPKIDFKKEIKIAKMLLNFSIPVILAALSEMAIYDIDTFLIGHFLPTIYLGYYSAADPIARLPLVISISVATAALPAASEAYSLKNKKLLEDYVTQSYRIVMLTVLPICVGIAVFASPVISLLFGSQYVPGAEPLRILVMGMTFYTFFVVSSSIIQGVGRPSLPMYILFFGTILNFIFNWFLIPIYGMVGAATATSSATFIIMLISMFKTFEVTGVKPPFSAFAKIIIASLLLGIILSFLPKTIFMLILMVFISPVIYTIFLMVLKGFEEKDIKLIKKAGRKMGPLAKYIDKIANILEKFIS